LVELKQLSDCLNYSQLFFGRYCRISSIISKEITNLHNKNKRSRRRRGGGGEGRRGWTIRRNENAEEDKEEKKRKKKLSKRGEEKKKMRKGIKNLKKKIFRC